MVAERLKVLAESAFHRELPPGCSFSRAEAGGGVSDFANTPHLPVACASALEKLQLHPLSHLRFASLTA